MYEQMEESTDRCFAYNKAGQRCEMIAGHDRDHNVVIAWTSEESWRPGDPNSGTILSDSPGVVVVEHLVDEPAEVFPPLPNYPIDGSRCFCGHPMHLAPCEVGNCDCKTGL